MAKTVTRKIKRSPGDQLVQVFIYVFVGAFALITLLPFVYIVAGSFATERELTERAFFLFPQTISTNAYQYIFKTGDAIKGLKNSIIVTVSVVVIVLLSTSLAGYVMGRYSFVGKGLIMKIFMASITIPLVFTVIPIYELLKNMGLSQSLVGLILAESGGGHVIFLMLFSSFYASIPNEMEEAATIDGANFVQTYGSVMFPLAKPIMVTVVIMQFNWTWNSFLLPLIITLNNPSLRTLAVGLYALRGENVVDWTGIAAGASIAIVPVICVFIALQRYFVDGIAGAVKS